MSPWNAKHLAKNKTKKQLMGWQLSCVLFFDAMYHHRQSSCNMPSRIVLWFNDSHPDLHRI